MEDDNTTVYGIRKMLRPIHKSESETKDPNIVILDSIIQSAHHRIAMYETLDKGLWNSIFGTDNTDEIVKERELIREFEQMKQEIILWQTKNTIPPYSK